MIELKIPTSAAVVLLKERMEYELKMRKKGGKYFGDYSLEDLDFDELLSIAECAAFDIIYTLPFEILSEDNNLIEIIYKAFVSLEAVFDRKEFGEYSLEQAILLLRPINKLFLGKNNSGSYIYN